MNASPSDSTAIRWLDRLLIVELVALTFLLGCFLDKDADIWWHLRAGREILGGGGIPRTDSYLFGASGAEWIDLHWGFQAAAAWIFMHGGFRALTLAAAGAAACAAAIGIAATTRGRSGVAVVWCWLPAVFVMSARFYPRPETLSLVFLAAVLLILHEAAARPRLLWLLVPLLAAWVNVHALFVLGLVILGCWLLDRMVDAALSGTRHDWRHLATVSLATVAATFLNPYTWKGVLFPLTLFTRMSTERGFYAQHIGELASIPSLVLRTGISSVYVRVSFLLLAATATSFALRRIRSPLVAFRLLLFLAFGALGLLASRNQPQFAIVAGAVLAWNVGDWLAARPDPPLVERAAARILTSAVLVGLMIWVVTGRFYQYAGEGRLAGLGEHPFWYAHDAAKFASGAGMPRRFIAYHEGQAAVLEFHMQPDQRVFVDPRLEVTPRDALERYYALAASMARRAPEWPGLLRSLPQPLGVLVDHGSHHAIDAALLASDNWRCVWFDAVAGVYVPSGDAAISADRTVDFAARYFSNDRDARQVSEAESLYKVGRDLAAAPAANAQLGRLLLLLAAARVRDAAGPMVVSPGLGQILAGTSLGLFGYPDAKTKVSEWPLEAVLGVARARYVLNRAVTQTPTDFQSWLGLFGIAQALGDPDALWYAGTHLVELHAANAGEFEVQRQTRVALRSLMAVRASEPPIPLPIDATEIMTTAGELVEQHRFGRALNLLERSVGYGFGPGTDEPSWEFRNLRGMLFLLSGDPGRARAVWSEENRPEHRVEIERRRANVAFVEGRAAEAAALYRNALDITDGPASVRYGLALALLELRDAPGFVRECEAASRSGDLPATAAEFCRDMRSVAASYVDGQGQGVPRRSGGSADNR